MHKSVPLIMQLGGLIILTASILPYLVVGVPYETRLFLGMSFGVLLALTAGVGWYSRNTVYHFFAPGEPNPTEIQAYVTLAGCFDLVFFGLLVAVTGGLTESSFVSLLFLIPVLVMIASLERREVQQPTAQQHILIILILFTAIFACLIALEFPSVGGLLQKLPPSFGLFKGTAVPSAYKASVILNLGMTVYALFLQYAFSQRQR